MFLSKIETVKSVGICFWKCKERYFYSEKSLKRQQIFFKVKYQIL